jgi:hypothetical protein
MTPLHIQRLIAAVFIGLGGWCLVLPGMVADLTLTPAFRGDDPVIPILVGCFGAQAVLAGLFAAFSRFTRTTFLVYGLALLPFFVFDFWFYAVKPVFIGFILLDLAGNLIMLALCFVGWRQSAPSSLV